MSQYYKYYSTPEKRTKAVLEALDKTHKKNMASKEEALAFLERAGIILEDAPKPKAESETKKSK